MNELIRVGMFCENLLADPTFQSLSAAYEHGCVNEMLATEAHESKKRDAIYNRIIAHREFLSLMGTYVAAKQKAIEPASPDQIIDDPSVHNILED